MIFKLVGQGVYRKRLKLDKRIGDTREYRETHHNLEPDAELGLAGYVMFNKI